MIPILKVLAQNPNDITIHFTFCGYITHTKYSREKIRTLGENINKFKYSEFIENHY